MPAASALTIADSTPTNHTFNPYQKQGNMVLWAEKTTPHTSAAYYILSDTYRPAAGKSTVNRRTTRLAMPIEVLNTTTGLYEVSSIADGVRI